MQKKLVKRILAGAVTALLIGCVSGSVWAAEEREKIDKVYIDVDSDIERNTWSEDLTITTKGTKYTIDEYTIVNAPYDKWSGHDCPRVTIYISANSGYYFKSNASSYFKLSGDADKVVSAKREDDNSYLVVTVDLKPIDQEVGNPIDLDWTSAGSAVWSKAYKGETYQVALYRDGSRVDSEETNKLTYDFSAKMGEAGDYTFRVRAISAKSDYSDWVESPVFKTNGGQISNAEEHKKNTNGSEGPGVTALGNWKNDEHGWWFENPDNTYLMSEWKDINGAWYYFNSQGYMLTGLQNINDKWYYLDSNGVMKTGWVYDGNCWRYFGVDGGMLVNTQTPDGFHVDNGGVWIQ